MIQVTLRSKAITIVVELDNDWLEHAGRYTQLIQGGPGELGPRDLRPMEPNWHTLYVYIHST